MSLKHRILGLGLAVALLAAPARAGEADKYLPADTEVYSVVNIRQLLNSALMKRIGLDNIKAVLESQKEVSDILKDLGLDPFKDVDRIISAGPATGEQDKGLFIINGRFDMEKIKATAAKKDYKEFLKPFKIGEQTGYEVVISEAGVSVFVGFPSKNTILAAMSKDYLGDALKVGPDATKANLKSKAFQQMLSKLDDKQSLSMVLLLDSLPKGALDSIPGDVKDLLAKVSVISGGVTVTDGVKIEFSGGCKAAADARKIKDAISNGLNLVIGFAGIAAMNQKELVPVIDFLKSIRTTTRDKTVTIKAEISGEELNKVIPGGKDQ